MRTEFGVNPGQSEETGRGGKQFFDISFFLFKILAWILYFEMDNCSVHFFFYLNEENR